MNNGSSPVARFPTDPGPGPQLGTRHVARNLDLTAKVYQQGLFPGVLQVARGGRLAAPLVVDLDPTTVCDLACPECISADVLHHGQISSDRIVELAGELARSGVRAVVLIGGGEPLLHRSIDRVTRVLHEAGIALGLVTNGTMIGHHLDALAERLDWVRVSVDAGTRETYDRFRPGRRRTGVFPLVVSNMRRYAERKRGRLGYSFLLMQRFAADGSVTDTNYHEVFEAGRLAKEIGCDYFELKAMLDDDHFTVNQRAEDVAAVQAQLARLRELEDDGFTLLFSSNWTAVEEGLDPVQPKEYTSCHVAELRTTITPSGVYVCPYHRGDDVGRIGDIATASFERMWAEADTAAVDPSRHCRFRCARHETNLAVADLATGPVPIELVTDYDPFL